MTTTIPEARFGPGTDAASRSIRRLVQVMAVVLAAVLLAAGPAGAQETCNEGAGTLGIQGMRCEGCTFRMSESGLEEARFRTEPVVTAVVRGFTRGDALRAGDRVVAIDGALITTRVGSDRLVNLESGQSITVRVRRDGRVLDLALVAGSACALVDAVRDTEVEVEVDRIRESVYVWTAVPAPPAAEARTAVPLPPRNAPVPPRGVVPVLPPALGPTGYLGLGIRCSECGLRDDVYFFSAPPEITSVADDSPAAVAGLEPGDVILEIDGQDITGRGARRFGEVEPGQEIRFTVRRDGERRTVALTAGEREVRPLARSAPPARRAAAARGRAEYSDEAQYQGTLGDVRIEVVGAPITVEHDEQTGEIVIRTGGNVIRLTREGG